MAKNGVARQPPIAPVQPNAPPTLEEQIANLTLNLEVSQRLWSAAKMDLANMEARYETALAMANQAIRQKNAVIAGLQKTQQTKPTVEVSAKPAPSK